MYKGLSANIITQATSLLIQGLTIPVFLHFWGVDLYAQWILLYAVPAYFSFVDMGFGLTSSTVLAKALAKNDVAEALRIFQSTLFVTVSVGLALVVLGAVLLPLVPVRSLLRIHNFSDAEVNASIILLILYVVANQQQGIFNGIYNYNGQFHFIANMNSVFRLAEFVLIAATVVCVQSAAVLSAVMLLGKLLQTLWVVRHSKQVSPWMKIGFQHKDYAYIKAQLQPSLSLLLYPVSFAILNQGISILIGRSLGNLSLVLFNTLRTLVGSVKTFASQVNNLLFAELIKFFAFNEVTNAKAFYKKTVVNTTLLILFCGVVLTLFGPLFITTWTHGALTGVPQLYILFFVLEALTYNLWHANYQTYLAQNRHTRLTVVFFGAALGTVCLTSVFLSRYGIGFFLLTAAAANLLLYSATRRNLFNLLR